MCIDTGAQESAMPEAIYKSLYGSLSKSDRGLFGAGNVPLVTHGCAVINLSIAETVIKKRVYVIRGASKLRLGVATIGSVGLFQEIPGTYSVKALNQMPDSYPLRLGTKEDIVDQAAPALFHGMFKRLPFGISSAPEYFQKRRDKKLSGIEGVKCRMDDILAIGRDQAEHDQRLKQFLDRLVERILALNLEKCLFSQTRLQLFRPNH